jgi:Ni,Fe-hydrogenase III large subunit
MTLLTTANAEPVARAAVPRLAPDEFRRAVIAAVNEQPENRLSAFFGVPSGEKTDLYAVVARPLDGTLGVVATTVGDAYPALTPDCFQAHWFEREVAEQWGVRPEGHPWLKPIRFHRSYRAGKDAWGRPPEDPILPSVTDFFRVEGDEVHEVAVGPVHAGVIEPGHFRFQCHGETVYHLEISLGYQHRGVERHLVGGPGPRTVHYLETLAGDTTVGHATAYAHSVEALAGCPAPPRAQALRAVALELERQANHTGDLGALSGDVGFLPTAAFCGRLRGDFLNATAQICGSRFGRSLVRPGGVNFDLDPPRSKEITLKVEAAVRDVVGAGDLLWRSPSVMARFEETGTVARKACDDLGIVGPAARAAGAPLDVRRDFPAGLFRFAQVPVAGWHTGDVFARAYVRWLEVQHSGDFIQEQLSGLPAGPLKAKVGPLRPGMLVVSLVEGWRGEICHVALTDDAGRFAHYKVVDPSFHNWIGLAMALRNQQISDFPLCNKSFNLSYCGHDL